MNKISKDIPKVALIDFSDEEKHFWQKTFFGFGLKWQLIGSVKGYQVLFFSIPWKEKDFVKFDLDRQRNILLKILKNAYKKGCVVVGLPMRWRKILSGNNKVEIPSAKELALEKAIYDLGSLMHGFQGKKVSILGVDDRFAKIAADKLLAKGVHLMLSGTKAKSLSDWYYKNCGLAVPVFRTEKAGEAADGILSLNDSVLRKFSDKTIIYGDVDIEIKGTWQAPFENGKFPCGLAAAILSVGGETVSGIETTKNNSSTINENAV